MKIKIALGVLLVVVLAVVAVSLLTGGDDEDDEPTTAREQAGGGDGGGDDNGGGDDESDDAEPQLRTLAVNRSEGKNATTAVASPSVEKPKEFWLRVSAAPKQRVKGSWNVACSGGGGAELDTFEVTPPHLMKLRLPTKNPKSCIAGGSVQLTGEGRVKLAVLRER